MRAVERLELEDRLRRALQGRDTVRSKVIPFAELANRRDRLKAIGTRYDLALETPYLFMSA